MTSVEEEAPRTGLQRWVAAGEKPNKDRYERGAGPGGGRLEREEPGQGTPQPGDSPLWEMVSVECSPSHVDEYKVDRGMNIWKAK